MAGQDHVLSKAFLATVAGFTNNIILGQCVVAVDAGAGLQLDPNQVALCSHTTGGGNTAASPVGLALENLDLIKIQTGKAYFSVAIAGIAYGIADGAILSGATVVPSTTTDGQLHSQARANPVAGIPQVGIALSHAAAAGDIFSVLLTPGARV